MGFITGQQLFCFKPMYWGLVEFVEDDEGWPMIRTMEGSRTTVRPSEVRPLNERTLLLVVANYESAIAEAPRAYVKQARKFVEDVADAIRFDISDELARLDALEVKKVQG